MKRFDALTQAKMEAVAACRFVDDAYRKLDAAYTQFEQVIAIPGVDQSFTHEARRLCNQVQYKMSDLNDLSIDAHLLTDGISTILNQCTEEEINFVAKEEHRHEV